MLATAIRAGAFWTFFFLACAWLLPRYYQARGRRRAQELRYAAIAIDALVLLSLALPWIPASRGGPVTGVAILTGGDGPFAAFVLSVFAALALLSVGNNVMLLKIAASLQLISIVVLFVAMVRLLPGTFTATPGETAPFFAAMLLLCGSVAVLLLWHQLQGRERDIA